MLGVDHPTDVSWATTAAADPMPFQSLSLTGHFVEGEVMRKGQFRLDITRCFSLKLAVGESFFVADELDLILIHHHHLSDRVQD